MEMPKLIDVPLIRDCETDILMLLSYLYINHLSLSHGLQKRNMKGLWREELAKKQKTWVFVQNKCSKIPACL